jgi:short-subunit dehydrogenase
VAANKKKQGTVLITGASSGIGRQLALEFGPQAAETRVLAARRLDRLEQLREQLLGRCPGLKAVVLAADLSDEHEAERLRPKVSEQPGAVDVLVKQRGIGRSVVRSREAAIGFGRGPDGSAKCRTVCTEQALRGRFQRGAARRPFRNRRHL